MFPRIMRDGWERIVENDLSPMERNQLIFRSIYSDMISIILFSEFFIQYLGNPRAKGDFPFFCFQSCQSISFDHFLFWSEIDRLFVFFWLNWNRSDAIFGGNHFLFGIERDRMRFKLKMGKFASDWIRFLGSHFLFVLNRIDSFLGEQFFVCIEKIFENIFVR